MRIPENFLSARITRYPDLSRRPGNVSARRELFRVYEELLMDMDRAESFDRLSFGWVLPKYENDDYTLDGAKKSLNLNNPYEKGGHTHLTYEIAKRRDGWRNLIRRLSRGINMVGNYDPETGRLDAQGFVTDPAILEDLYRMRDLRRGQRLVINNPWVRFEVEMWAGAGFQPIGRTIRGLMRYEDSNRLLTSLSYYGQAPEAGMSWEEMVEQRMQERFQPLLGFQILQSIQANNDALMVHYRRLFTIYPNLEMVYVLEEALFFNSDRKRRMTSVALWSSSIIYPRVSCT